MLSIMGNYATLDEDQSMRESYYMKTVYARLRRVEQRASGSVFNAE